MPENRKRKRRDGSVAKFRAPAQPVRRSAPAARTEREEDHRPAVLGRPAKDLSPVASDGTSYKAGNENAVARLANVVRAEAGVPALRTDERLRAAARGHSADMAKRDFCEHVNPDGAAPADRMRAAGYPHPAGENVARGQESPHSVMRAWMNSPGHRANLVNPDFVFIGVGVYFGPGGPCWTQNFGY